jgi:hypothetical protein
VLCGHNRYNSRWFTLTIPEPGQADGVPQLMHTISVNHASIDVALSPERGSSRILNSDCVVQVSGTLVLLLCWCGCWSCWCRHRRQPLPLLLLVLLVAPPSSSPLPPLPPLLLLLLLLLPSSLSPPRSSMLLLLLRCMVSPLQLLQQVFNLSPTYMHHALTHEHRNLFTINRTRFR